MTAPEPAPESNTTIEISDVSDSTVVAPAAPVRDSLVAGRDINVFAAEMVRTTSGRSQRTRRDRDALLRGDESFVEPDGFHTVADVLVRRRLVVLTGDPDDGLKSAAWHLMTLLARQLKEAKRQLSADEVLLDEDLDLAGQLDDQGPHGLVVHLARGDHADIERFFRGLGALPDGLDAHDGFLVATLPAWAHDRFEREFPERVHRLRPPAWDAVFRSHLGGTEASAVTDECLHDEWLRSRLAGQGPPQVARIATFVAQAYRDGRRQTSDLLVYARNLDEDWSGELRRLLADNDSGTWRSLLIAAAALEGAGPTAVTSAADLLLRCAEYEPEATHALERPGVTTRLRPLAGTELDPETTVFGRARFGDSVLAHVWEEHFDLRPTLRKWFAAIPADGVDGLTRADVERFADRFVDLFARHDGSVILHAANVWIRAGAQKPLLKSLAVRVLGQASVDRRVGKLVRANLYHWSRRDPGEPTRQVVVAEVCGGDLGRAFPRNALVRLKHLATNAADPVADAVVDATLAIADDTGVPRLLRYLTTWFDGAVKDRADVLQHVLATVMSNEESEGPLGAIPATALDRRASNATWQGNAVSEFWQRALADDVPYEQSAPLVAIWLDTAVRSNDRAHRESLVELLVDAAGRSLSRIGRLYHVGRRWPLTAHPAAASGDHDEVRDYLLTRLDEIDPLVTVESSRREGSEQP